MKQQLRAEAQILNRIMYLLEENSVQHLMQSDEGFASYVDELYIKLQSKSVDLQTVVH